MVPFILRAGGGGGPFSLLKKPLFGKNKEEAKANNKVRQSPLRQQPLTCSGGGVISSGGWRGGRGREGFAVGEDGGRLQREGGGEGRGGGVMVD